MNNSTKIILSLLIIVMIVNIVPYGISFDTVESTSTSDSFTSLPDDSSLSGEDAIVSNVEEMPSDTIIEEEPDITPTEKAIVTPTPVSSQKLTSNTLYYIKVNKRQNVVTIYTKDADGNYTIPYKAMICSIGEASPATGRSYKVTSYRSRWNGLVGGVYGQYATQIVGDILFHSVPYTARNPGTLEYWEFDKLGTTASKGCVRLTVEDSKWIYDNISAGTIVEFYEDDNPGPLGKPSVQLISNNERCRDWDPTDPDSNNPWHLPEPVEETIIEEESTSSPSSVEDIIISDEPFIEDISSNNLATLEETDFVSDDLIIEYDT